METLILGAIWEGEVVTCIEFFLIVCISIFIIWLFGTGKVSIGRGRVSIKKKDETEPIKNRGMDEKEEMNKRESRHQQEEFTDDVESYDEQPE